MMEFVEAFGNQIVPLFEKHEAKLIGAWQTAIGQSNEFVYILGFKDLTDRERFWQVLPQDEQFRAYMQGGTRTAYIISKILRPIPSSPLK